MPRFRSHRRLCRALALAGAASVVACALPAAAGAHAYLVHSEPSAGARLASPPSRIVLRFSEAYVADSERLTLRRGDGTQVPLTKPSGRGVLVVQPLPLLRRGVYVATWRVVSDDGHLSAGELAFSIGSAEALPAVSASEAPTPWAQIVASWVFFAGLALAFGGLLSERFVLRVARPRAPAGIGAGMAAVASFVLLILLAGDRVGGGFVAGSHGDALQAVLSTRPGALTFAVLLATALGALVAEAGALRPLAIIPLAAAAILTAVHGHSGTSGHWWAPVVDSIHLLGAAAWVGALAHLVLVVWRAPDRAAARALAIRRYSRLALPTVLIILASGVLTAFGEFRSVGSAFHSGYGQTLIVKSALVLAALGVAAASRLLALPANPGIKLPLLRRLTLSEILLLVGVLAAVGLLVNLAPPRTAAAPAAPTVSPLLPGAIPTGPFVDAREDGDLAVGFAAEPAGAGRLKLTTTVIAGDGGRATGPRSLGQARIGVGVARARRHVWRRLLRGHARIRGPSPGRVRDDPPAGSGLLRRALRLSGGLAPAVGEADRTRGDARVRPATHDHDRRAPRVERDQRRAHEVAAGGAEQAVVLDRGWASGGHHRRSPLGPQSRRALGRVAAAAGQATDSDLGLRLPPAPRCSATAA